MNKSDTILVTGSAGLVGSALVRALKAGGFTNVWGSTRKDADLKNEESTNWYFSECRPDYVFHCAAKVGGIEANINKSAEFLLDNLAIQANVLRAAHLYGAKKLLFVSSAAVYPDSAKSPLSPESLMTGPFDETKAGYAMAKLAGMQMCKEFRRQYGSAFLSVIPNNIYGPGDNYRPESSHVIPAMLRRFHDAAKHSFYPTCWGTGDARREFVYVDDLADACLLLMENYDGVDPVNVGQGRDWPMRELAALVASTVGYCGPTLWDTTKPEGTPQRLLDSRVLFEFGWTPKTCLLDGLIKTYKDFLTTL